MWNQKLCLGLSGQFGIVETEQIELFAKVGFDAFFAGWERGCDVKSLRETGDRVGLEFQSIHAPFVRMDRMWKDAPDTDDTVNELIECLHDCAEYNVPIMVAHAFIGFNDHTPTEKGIETFGRVADEAEKLGVKLALENTEGEEYLAALFDALGDRENVGFCWDTGHEMCYNHSADMPGRFGQNGKLFCTHLNDNLGIRDFSGKITWIDDLHLLPFDGIADWAGIAKRLDLAGFDGIMTFELNKKSKPDRHENDAYDRMSIEDYITETYKRACRVAALRGKV